MPKAVKIKNFKSLKYSIDLKARYRYTILSLEI